jgi:hypothetical protein
MPNGKPDDHPLTDILHYGRDVYSSRAAGLVREIAGLADEKALRELGDLLFNKYNEFSNPDVATLEKYLTELRDRLRQEARDRGFEAC